MNWTDAACAELLRLRREGKSFSECGRVMGCTKRSALAKYHRLVGTPFPSIGKPRPYHAKKQACDDWERRLTETWSERKKRLARERQVKT